VAVKSRDSRNAVIMRAGLRRHNPWPDGARCGACRQGKHGEGPRSVQLSQIVASGSPTFPGSCRRRLARGAAGSPFDAGLR